LDTVTGLSNGTIRTITTNTSLYVHLASDSSYMYAALHCDGSFARSTMCSIVCRYWGFVARYYTNSYASEVTGLCPESCRDHGTCVNGACVCDAGKLASGNCSMHFLIRLNACSGYRFDNCVHDDRVRLAQMMIDMDTPGLAASLNWSTDPSTTDDFCLWTGVRCYENRVYQIELQHLSEH